MIEQKPTGKELVSMIIDRLTTDNISISIVNNIATYTLMIYALFYNEKRGVFWWFFFIAIICVHIAYNIIIIYRSNLYNSHNKRFQLMKSMYEAIGIINQKLASEIYDLEIFVDDRMKDLKPINKNIFNNIVNIDDLSANICENIYKALTDVYGKEIDCEVTVFRRNLEYDYIKMIAYSNNGNERPDSFAEEYSLNSKNEKMCHVRTFMKNKKTIVCLPNKTSVRKAFMINEKSKEREENITQYIGYPIKTNRDKVELLLQIDVAKDNILGKNKKEMQNLAKELIHPFITMLNIALERDIMFNRYYKLIESLLSNRYFP